MPIIDQIKEFLEKSRKENIPALIVVLGATASGKSSFSLKLAHMVNGEIINADSRQIYKEMSIGTDKPSEIDQKGIKHHLYDIVSPDEDFNLADYKRLALKTIDEVIARGHTPILCGGTGLYISAVIENYQIPQIAPQPYLREKYEDYYSHHGASALYNLLKEKNPEAAKNIQHPNNVRYVIRALEISDMGGQALQGKRGAPLFNVFAIEVERSREELYDRINRRVDEMIDNGLINEVKNLLLKGYNEKLHSMSSLGYPEIIAYIKGEMSLDEAAETIKKNTRNYAKRQLTWFRRYRNVDYYHVYSG
jgi:tRNA dimethylallyltransferase